MDILEKLCHKFTGRGGIWLHIDEYGIVNELLAAPVMVHYDDAVCLCEQLRLLHHRGLVRINYNDKRA
ncbi:hypothetical protein D3C72_2538450 [compost metagenome]